MEKFEKDQLLIKAMDEYGHYLTRLAYAFVKDEVKAEDIVQEVFIRYYLNIENFEGRSSVKTYLYRITVNECHNYFKSWSYRKMELSNLVSNLLTNKQTTEEEILQKEQAEYVAIKINELPSKYKEVLWLHYYAELSVLEIGEVLKCSPNTVKTRLVRGRNAARLTLNEEEIQLARRH
ncbi:sigma-70 family RNA polymerase sigma factor [Psychrobacillus sp. INOP01]|uniref:sigma-70 family RNA polymerase sigma factor n=1 Tax=Psychrobacillus sp. INOP01 TaxID=2829187 RepID=UPI001BAB6AF8|nr:sigma-70 family RNA polymerase sigma factor [Psychrobacillus sp. INOP01]QUG42948.1 sigma-70 family RNA polymerase sigma factor [Psychrobacillus sp. INOP01]